MIKINLLPKEKKELIHAKRFNLYLTSISTLVLFLIGILILGLFFVKLTFANQVKGVENQITEQQNSLSELNDQKTIVENFNKTISSAKTLINQDINWLSILNSLEAATPSKMKLTKFEIGGESDKQTDPNSVVISGNAASQLDIVSFIDKLDKSKYFSQTTLVSSKLGSEKSTSYTFEVKSSFNTKGNSNETN